MNAGSIQGGPEKNKLTQKFNLQNSLRSLIFILSPIDANPTGILWSKDELKQLSQSCVRY